MDSGVNYARIWYLVIQFDDSWEEIQQKILFLPSLGVVKQTPKLSINTIYTCESLREHQFVECRGENETPPKKSSVQYDGLINFSNLIKILIKNIQSIPQPGLICQPLIQDLNLLIFHTSSNNWKHRENI